MNLDVLKSISAFASVEQRYLRELVGYARETLVPAGVDLVEQGSYSRDFVAIVEGEADVLRDGALVGNLVAGDCFGEIGALQPTPRIATVTARTPMRLVTFTSWDVRRLGQDVLVEIGEQLNRRLTVHIE
jgi:CRP-like cAMP-binding protein